jgi:hypothetical protein
MTIQEQTSAINMATSIAFQQNGCNDQAVYNTMCLIAQRPDLQSAFGDLPNGTSSGDPIVATLVIARMLNEFATLLPNGLLI